MLLRRRSRPRPLSRMPPPPVSSKRPSARSLQAPPANILQPDYCSAELPCSRDGGGLRWFLARFQPLFCFDQEAGAAGAGLALSQAAHGLGRVSSVGSLGQVDKELSELRLPHRFDQKLSLIDLGPGFHDLRRVVLVPKGERLARPDGGLTKLQLDIIHSVLSPGRRFLRLGPGEELGPHLQHDIAGFPLEAPLAGRDRLQQDYFLLYTSWHVSVSDRSMYIIEGVCKKHDVGLDQLSRTRFNRRNDGAVAGDQIVVGQPSRTTDKAFGIRR